MDQDHDKNEDLFRQMAEKLRGHTEPYRQGAWEQFATKSGITQRPKRTMWPYWAAAVLLVAVSATLLLWQPADPAALPHYAETGERDEVAKSATGPALAGEDDDAPTAVVPEAAAPSADAPTYAVEARRAEPTVEQPVDIGLAVREDPAETQAIALELVDTLPGNLVIAEVQAEDPAQPLAVQIEEGIPPVVEGDKPSVAPDPAASPFGQSPALYADHGKDVQDEARTEQGSRWGVSVVVSPSLTNEKFNMGGGLALAYRISDKFSVSSGVSLAEMGVGQYPAEDLHGGRYASADFNSPQNTPVGSGELTAGYETLGNSYLTSVTSSLLAMDVPLDLRYHVSDRFYSSVGMSLFAVLDERRTVHYTTTTVSQNMNGPQYNRREFSQQAAQQPIADQRVGGFLNFSVGHRVPLSKRVSLSLEPYFKVPMGNLSKQDMNLNHGGLKIVTGF